VAYALESQSQYRTVFERVLAGGTPLLFHCSAGKDRTGFGAALVLTAVGVAWPDVVADFEATNRLWRRDTVPAADIPPAIRESLLRAEPLLLEAAFAAARAQHGSMDAYYERALGLGPAERRRLDQILLEPG
jgi:protein-tyrosine phosphatase